MKLTAKKLKELIKEEMDNLHELDLDLSKKPDDPMEYFDSLVNQYMKGLQNHPDGKKELQAAKESLAEAIQALEVKEITIPVSEDIRPKYRGFLHKAVQTWVDEGSDENRGKMDFKVLRNYLRDSIISGFPEAVAKEFSKRRTDW